MGSERNAYSLILIFSGSISSSIIYYFYTLFAASFLFFAIISITSLKWPQSSQTSSTSSLPSLLDSTSTSMASIYFYVVLLIADRGYPGDQCRFQARTKVRSGAHTQRRHGGHRLTNVIFAIRVMIQLLPLTYLLFLYHICSLIIIFCNYIYYVSYFLML